MVSGLRINFHNSGVVKVGKKRQREKDWAAIFRCKKASLPITYLGMPLGAKSKLKAFWYPVLLRIEKRLAYWNKKFLSKGFESVVLMHEMVGCVVLPKRVCSRLVSWVERDVSEFEVKKSLGYDFERGYLDDLGRVKLCALFQLKWIFLDVNTVELMAIHKACTLCVLKPFFVKKEIIISSDSSTAVSWVNDKYFGNLCLWEIITDIRSMLRLLGNTSVIFCSRDVNDIADELAIKGSSMVGEIVEWRDF
ncbi:hypothetical protein Ddye_011321 [Dipteronia dyeriana]|uniref:RNase H type-1 domain-containing protein n=1 Tax=Dipteronia dyeriana TaxID=168575 RepID=A0AAD9X2A7_9ROSI|nr:hypothetical protein Ddye_011321 [Dipteronia dyeriana]